MKYKNIKVVNSKSSRMSRLIVLCPYPEGVAPSQRLKYEQYFDVFLENGYEVIVIPFMSQRFWDIRFSSNKAYCKTLSLLGAYLSRIYSLPALIRADIVYVHLWCTPVGLPLYEWLVRLLAKKLVYDIDDLIFAKKEEKGFLDKLSNSFFSGAKARYLLRTSDAVITCTPFLTEFSLRFNHRVHQIPSTVCTNRFAPRKRRHSRELVLGWTGSHSTIKYLRSIEEPLRALAATKAFTLLVIGDKNYRVQGIRSIAFEWSESIETEMIPRMDIGLYPLINEFWVNGKSGLKAIQYMAVGIPVVASNFGCTRTVVEDGVTGFTVDHSHEWVERLALLLDDTSLRLSMGALGRSRVESLYSVQSNKEKYLGVLSSL